MNILQELAYKITTSMRYWLESTADHFRPQDEVPTERVVHRIVADYQRMYNERQALIEHIRQLEQIYKNAQLNLFKAAVQDKSPTRKRLLEATQQTLYSMTSHHRAVTRLFKKNIGMTEEDNTI